MPAKKKNNQLLDKNLTRLFAVFATLLALFFWLFSAKKLGDETAFRFRGDLEADVSYIGLTCPTRQIPCANAYPNYPARIRDRKTNTIIAVALSDTKGHLSLNLPTGDYYWESNEKVMGGKTAHIDFSIMTNQITRVEFIIDTGIR